MPSARRFAQLTLLVVLAISGCRKRTAGPEGDIIAAIAPLPTADDSAFDAQSLRGKPTLVLFASPTCGYCIKELPIAKAAAEKEKANLVAVFISGNKKSAASVTQTAKFDAPVLVDEGRELSKKYEIKGVPYMVVVGPDGRATEALRGLQEEDTLRDALDDAR
jgi:thiol-disulfide isomerase/thioredoxin